MISKPILKVKPQENKIKTMNGISSFLAAGVITISITASATSLKTIDRSPEDKPISATIQADVYKIFQSSCIDCHAKGGKKMAMSHVNFSEWDNYSTEKKRQRQLIL